jgi:hypothetical protein
MPQIQQSKNTESSKNENQHSTENQDTQSMNQQGHRNGSALRASFQRAENPTLHRSKAESGDNGFRSAKSKRTTPPEPFHTSCLHLRSDTQREKDSGSCRYCSTLGSLIVHASSSCRWHIPHYVPAGCASRQSSAFSSAFRFPVGGAPDQRAIARAEKNGEAAWDLHCRNSFLGGQSGRVCVCFRARWSSDSLGGDRCFILGPMTADGRESRGCRLVRMPFAVGCAAVLEFGQIAFVIHPPPTLSHLPPVSLSLTGPLARLARQMLPAREAGTCDALNHNPSLRRRRGSPLRTRPRIAWLGLRPSTGAARLRVSPTTARHSLRSTRQALHSQTK